MHLIFIVQSQRQLLSNNNLDNITITVDKSPRSPDHTTLEKPYDIKTRSDYLSALPKCHTPPSTPSAPVKFDGLKMFRYVSFLSCINFEQQ